MGRVLVTLPSSHGVEVLCDEEQVFNMDTRGREMPITSKFDMDQQLVGDVTKTSDRQINCHLMYVSNQIISNSHV